MMMINPVFQSRDMLTANSKASKAKAPEGQDFSKIFSRQMKEHRDRKTHLSEPAQANKSSSTFKKPEAEPQNSKAVNQPTKPEACPEAEKASRQQAAENVNPTTPEIEGEIEEDAAAEGEPAIAVELLAKEVLELLLQLKQMAETPEEKVKLAEAITEISNGLSLGNEALLKVLDSVLGRLNKQLSLSAAAEKTEPVLSKLSSLLEEKGGTSLAVAEKTDSEGQAAKTEKLLPKTVLEGVPANNVKLEAEADNSTSTKSEAPNTTLAATAQQQPIKAAQKPGENGSIVAEAVTDAADNVPEEGVLFVEGQRAVAEKNEQLSKFISTMKQEIQKNDPQNLLNRIAGKVEVLAQSNKNEIRMQLSPEALGNLFIKLSMEKGALTARVFTENYQVKELLESNLNQLKINLSEKGIAVSSLEVSVGQQQESFQFKQSLYHGKPKPKRSAEVGALLAAGYIEESRAANPYVTSSNFEGLA